MRAATRRRALTLFVSMVLPLPMDTPIPCLICRETVAQSAVSFRGTVSRSDAAGLSVYDFSSLRVMSFIVPADFRGVSSADGTIADATLARVEPGLFVRVTYTSAHGRNVAIGVLVLNRETIPSRNLL
jgi:hypothetical protein